MIILKEVYREGFGYDAVQDRNPIIPAVVDITATTSQMPSGYPTTDFVNWDAGMNAAKFTVDITKPTTTATMHTARVEHTTRYPLLQSEEDIWLSMSYFFINSVNDPLYEIIYQYHSGDGTGSPPFAIQRQNSRFRFRIWLGSGFLLNQMVFDLGEATDNVWHNFIVKLRFDDTMNGRLTVWKDGQLARCHNPLTGDPWVVPTSSWAGSDEYVMHPSMGAIQEEIGGISVLDYKGKTSHTYPSAIKFPKWGMYKSPWQGRYDPVTGDVLPNIYDPDDPLYVEPGNRIKEFYLKNIKFETRHNEFSHSKIFETLDVNGEGPIDVPDWWIEDSPINIISPTNGQNIIEGTPTNIVTDAEDGDVDLIVEGNLIDTKINPPYSFTINNIPRNGSVIDLPFNGNLHQWGIGENNISIINPTDISYEPSPRGQAIVLGGAASAGSRSYLSIDNSGYLSAINNEFTISFYIKSIFGSGLNPIVLSNNDGSNGSGISINGISNGTLEARLFEENESYVNHRISISSLLDPEEYNHYTLTYDGSVIRWYYNFNFVNESNVGLLNISASKDWYINAAANQQGRQNFSISDLRIYDYAVFEEDIEKTVEDNFLGQLELKVRRLGMESDPVIINIVEELPDTYEGPYYVSNDGDNSNEGSLSEPIATVSKLNEILSEGIDNSVNFNRGDVFEGGVDIPTLNDGTAQNPIEFKPYGSGDIPVLSGFKPIGSFSNVSGNLYEVQDDNFPEYIYNVKISDSLQPKGRLPKTDWLRADSTTSSSMTSTNFPSVDYSGGEVEAVMWKMQWVIDTVKVTGLVGDQMNYTGGSSYPFSARTDGRYFIQNAIECLTEDGDWMYDTNTKTLTIFSSVNPNTLSIAYSSDRDGIEGIGNTFNHYQDLSLDGSINGLDLEGSDSNHISGLNIKDQSGDGIAVRNSHNVVVEDADITDVDVRGISFTNTSQSPTVTGNKVTNIALKVGNPLANGDEKGNGIYFSNSEDIDCQLNEVRNIGFNGIRFNHNNALISRNLVENFCLVKHDGSGIYTYGGGSGVNTHTGRVVSNNVVRIGGDALRPNVYGIYIDDNSENISHSGNLIKDIWNAGYYIHNSHDLSFNKDIIYGCGTLFKFGQDGSNELIRSNVITDMVFALTSKSDFGFEILSNSNDISSFFSINNNTYIVASNNQLVFTTRWVEGAKTFFNNVDFEGWKALGNDINSNVRYLNIPEYTILSEGSNKWDGTVGNYHQGGEVTVNVDGSDVEVLMSIQSGTTTRAEIHFRLDDVESDKDYIVRFRARALSGHQSLNLYMRQSNAPYRDLGGKTAAVVGSEWQDFEFLVTDLIAEDLAGYLIDCQSNQGTLEISDFEFVEAVVDKTNYEDYILPVSNISENTGTISVGSGWRNLNGEEVSEVELDSFESVVLLNDDLPVQEYEVTVTQTSGGNVTGGGTYEEGEEVTLTAIPDSGFVFIRWSNNETSNPYTFVASGDVSISAVFEEAGTEGPLSEITSPENNSLFTKGDPIEIEVSVTQGSNPIDRVELYIGGNLLSTIESPPYEYTWEDASPGVYNLTARVIDSEDIVGKSDPVLITVQDGTDPEPGYFTVNIKFNIV